MLAAVVPDDGVLVGAALVADVAGVDDARVEEAHVLAQLGGAHEAFVAVHALDLLLHGVLQVVAVQLVRVLERLGTHLWDTQL